MEADKITYCIKCGKTIDINQFSHNKGYCKECIPNIDTYLITHDLRRYERILKIKLKDLECKHIMYINNNNKDIYDTAIKAFYPNIQWGFYREHSIAIENAIINKMITDNFKKSIRITITESYVWCDNTHTAISYIRRKGANICIKDVPFYIVDTRNYPLKPLTICSEKENLWFDQDCIIGAIQNSLRLKYFQEKNNGRLRHWKIEDLMKQIEY